MRRNNDDINNDDLNNNVNDIIVDFQGVILISLLFIIIYFNFNNNYIKHI